MTLAPDMAACGVELGEKTIVAASADERATAEVDASSDATGEEEVAGAIEAKAARALAKRVAEALAPKMLATRFELGDEDVGVSGAGERASAHVNRRIKIARKGDIAGAVDRHVRQLRLAAER